MTITHRRGVALALALLLGVACVWSAADRVFGGTLLPALPPGFDDSANAQRAAGYTALRRKAADEAVRHARRAVMLDPASAASSSLLGSALFLAQRPQAAEAAFLVAAQLGWRDIPTQLYWMARALEVADYRTAALRAEALMRGNVPEASYRGLFATLEADPRGRDALVERLNGTPLWLESYLGQLGQLTHDQQARRWEVLRRAVLGGLRPNSATAGGMILEALGAGQTRAAATFRLALYPHAADPRVGLTNGDFARPILAGGPTPFDWNRPDVATIDAEAAPSPAGPGSVLSIRSADSARRVAAEQRLVLPPGRYRLRWRASAARAPIVSVLCTTPEKLLAEAGGAERSDWLEFAVEPGCAVQTIRISVDPLGGEAAWITGLRVERSGRIVGHDA